MSQLHLPQPGRLGLLTAISVVYMVPTIILYLLVRLYLIRATVVGPPQGAG